MKKATANPTNDRNIPLALAQDQRERGYAMTRAEFKALGYTDEQLSEANVLRAAELYAQMSERSAA